MLAIMTARPYLALTADVDNSQVSFADSGSGTISTFEIPQVKHLPTESQSSTVVHGDCPVTLDGAVTTEYYRWIW